MRTVTVEIKSRWNEGVLFRAEVDASTDANLRVRAAVEIAVKSGANLAWADLDAADLTGADLTRANLAGANLAGASLDGASLTRADLTRANLAGADLAGADLDAADLVGAHLAGAHLDDNSVMVGERPILQIGPIGSVSRYFVAYLTTTGIRLRAGCFFGTRKEFEAQLSVTHEDNLHAQEYRAALALIDAHARLWTPDASEQEAA